MEAEEKSQYQVEFTPSSKYYFYEVLEYFYEYYPPERAEELADELEQLAQSLDKLPHRGTLEKWLSERKKDYRFLLFKRTDRSEVKIIYFIEESLKKVYVTDFFPTEKDAEQIAERS